MLQDLHDLLQHYEESHVRFEDDDNVALYSDDWSNSDSSAPNSPQVLSRQLSVAIDTCKKRDADEMGSEDDDLAAFDTSILRSIVTPTSNASDSKKLKLSVPSTPTFADIPTPTTMTLSDEHFLAQANALFASAGMLKNCFCLNHVGHENWIKDPWFYCAQFVHMLIFIINLSQPINPMLINLTSAQSKAVIRLTRTPMD